MYVNLAAGKYNTQPFDRELLQALLVYLWHSKKVLKM